MVNQLYPVNYLNKAGISLRPLPYPYRAMLAICSDLDETPDLDTYLEISRFLNTTDNTKMGPGVGLEVGNSIYFDMPFDQFSYWNTSDRGRDIIRTLIQSGHIDCLHSYGDLATKRKHAERALNELDRNNCYLRVWVDHGQAPTNLGADIMCGRGDVPGDEAYHADMTLHYGIRYVWLGRVTNVIGQERRRRLSGIWTPSHPFMSMKALLKEMVKGMLARLGSAKYAIHLPNKVLRKVILRDGQETLEFLRSTFHWGGISYNDTGEGLKDVFTEKNLNLLVRRGGVSIIYTHLGKLKGSQRFSNNAVSALKTLKGYYEEKRILVTTTYRLLNFVETVNSIRWTTSVEGDKVTIDVITGNDDLSGLSFYVSDNLQVYIKKDGKVLPTRSYLIRENHGMQCVCVEWRPLEYPSF